MVPARGVHTRAQITTCKTLTLKRPSSSRKWVRAHTASCFDLTLGFGLRDCLRPTARSWLIPCVKALLLVLAVCVCACERADKTPKPAPPPTPTKPDPIQQARDEFELLPAVYSVGTHKLYSRGDFMPDGNTEAAFDQGDFIGRLRTLFGARDGDEYVFRHKKTGYVITAYSGNSGPSYGGGARYPGALPPANEKALFKASLEHPDDGAAEARRKADPVLAKGSPIDHVTRDHPLDMHELQTYMKHVEDADAGPELAAAVARLDALISAVPPADWETTYFYDEGPSVVHVGAKHGVSFDDELPADQAFEFLAKAAESPAPTGSEADTDLISYYLANKDKLADERPRVVAAYSRFVAAAKSSPKDTRDILLQEARDLGKELGVKP